MSGTPQGAKKAVKTKRKVYGEDVFADNGRLGGKARNASKKRFTPFSDPQFASIQGKRGSKKRWGDTTEGT